MLIVNLPVNGCHIHLILIISVKLKITTEIQKIPHIKFVQSENRKMVTIYTFDKIVNLDIKVNSIKCNTCIVADILLPYILYCIIYSIINWLYQESFKCMEYQKEFIGDNTDSHMVNICNILQVYY